MSKKTFFIFILIILLIIGGVFWFIFFRTIGDQSGQPFDPSDPSLFPFGQGTTTPTEAPRQEPVDTTIDLSDRERDLLMLLPLRQLWPDPVAGAAFVRTGTSTTAIRFVDRATGHMYESYKDTPDRTRISNVTMPQIHEAIWSQNGSRVILRYLRDGTAIQSFSASVPTTTVQELSQESSGASLDGVFLPQNIKDLSYLADKIMYIDPSILTGRLVESNMDGSGKTNILSTDFKDWRISRSSDSRTFLFTAPSGHVPGHGFILNNTNGSLSNVLNNMAGLTGTINRTASHILASAGEGQSVSTYSYSISNGARELLPIKTISDKCTWSNVDDNIIYCAVPNTIPQGVYPDDWYQGLISFNDRVWRIDVSTGESNVILDPQTEAIQSMDIIKLSVSPDDSHIIFVNKNDLSLWMYKME